MATPSAITVSNIGPYQRGLAFEWDRFWGSSSYRLERVFFGRDRLSGMFGW
jgi:hypothetical protein